MRYYKNLIIIGTSHISPESIKTVESLIINKKPDVVAIELDRGRFDGLISGDKSKIGLKEIKRIGFKGYVFAKFGHWIEKKLGSKLGVSPGDEMIKAARTTINPTVKRRYRIIFLTVRGYISGGFSANSDTVSFFISLSSFPGSLRDLGRSSICY